MVAGPELPRKLLPATASKRLLHRRSTTKGGAKMELTEGAPPSVEPKGTDGRGADQCIHPDVLGLRPPVPKQLLCRQSVGVSP